MNSAENPKFQSSKSALIQSWTALIFSETALKLEIFRVKKSALKQSFFSADFLWNKADNHWSLLKQLSSFLIFPESTLKILEFYVFQFLSSPDFFAIFLLGNLDLTFLEIIGPVQCCFRAVFLWNRAVSELFRAVFLGFSAVQRWSKFVTFWFKIVLKKQ